MNVKIAELKTYKAIYDDAGRQMANVIFGDDTTAFISAQKSAMEHIFKIINEL